MSSENQASDTGERKRKNGMCHGQAYRPEMEIVEDTEAQNKPAAKCEFTIDVTNSDPCGDDIDNEPKNDDEAVQVLLDENTLDDVFQEQGNNDVVQKNKDRSKENTQRSDLLVVLLSGLYGLLLVVMGGVIPIAETFAVRSDSAFESFYIYLYIVSIFFIIYVYGYLLRKNQNGNPFLARVRTLSRKLTSNSLRSDTLLKPVPSTSSASSGIKQWKGRVAVGGANAVHTGSFYLRLGAIVFGIGSMIHRGLLLTEILRVHDSDLPDHCTNDTHPTKLLLHLIFTFMQLYFVFSNSKMSIHRFKKIARFGLMHMCATNICIWCRHIVVETLSVMNEHHSVSGKEHAGTHGSAETTGKDVTPYALVVPISDHQPHMESGGKHELAQHSKLPELSCHWDDVFGSMVNEAGPYLYPCSIEYSIICAGILYIMWKNVGKGERKVHQSNDDEFEQLNNQTMSLDCSGASKGLFVGIFHFVAVVCCIIAFYVVINMDDSGKTASALSYVTEISSYILSLAAVVLAWVRMRHLHFVSRNKTEVEDYLILVALAGLYLFSIFSIVADLHYLDHINGIFSVVTNLLMMLQATVQTIFMFSAQRMVASRSEDERKKPGKEFVTFLLISNFAMWGINTFETQRNEHNPFQVEFYGHFAWAIFTHISVPLAIFYRFHSTVILSQIWKKCWKPKYRIT